MRCDDGVGAPPLIRAAEIIVGRTDTGRVAWGTAARASLSETSGVGSLRPPHNSVACFALHMLTLISISISSSLVSISIVPSSTSSHSSRQPGRYDSIVVF